MKICQPCNITVDYWAKDRIRRDVPGILDALYHLLEYSGIVTDDVFLGGEGCVETFRHHGKSPNPRVEITLH